MLSGINQSVAMANAVVLSVLMFNNIMTSFIIFSVIKLLKSAKFIIATMSIFILSTVVPSYNMENDNRAISPTRWRYQSQA